jgi:hypothetical protein
MKFMRRIFFLISLVLLISTSPLSMALAQQPVSELDSVQISFWPDFDDPSVLVLITGQLPQDTSLPAQVSIPIPEDAQINAVASIDEAGMVSIDFEAANENITFVTTNPRFRVEYYAPYQQNGLSRSYDFEWISELPVAELSAEVQQPANAETLTSEPAAANMYTNQTDGLFYHALDPRAVPAGTPYQLSFNYEMASNALTVGQAISTPGVTTEQGQEVVTPSIGGNNNWLLFAGIAGLVALVVIGTWILATRTKGKKSSRPVKPKPRTAGSSKPKAAVFCHNCGQAAEDNDRFCRRCGTELKRT